jgi:hypothetical protein
MNEPKNDTNPQFEELVQVFANPPRAYSPAPIWWWGGERLEQERLRWQLEQFAAGGVFNLVVLNLAPTGLLYGSDADDVEVLVYNTLAPYLHAVSPTRFIMPNQMASGLFGSVALRQVSPGF